jgi:hypothetical protein
VWRNFQFVKIINQRTLSFSFAPLNAPDAGNKLEGHFTRDSYLMVNRHGDGSAKFTANF